MDLAACLDTGLNLPIVSPNHLISVDEPLVSDSTSSGSDGPVVERENTVTLKIHAK